MASPGGWRNVRPALVAVGVVLLAVAAVSAGAAVLAPPAPTDQQVSTVVPTLTSGPNQTRQVWLDGTNTSDGSFDLSWQASAPVVVDLYRAPGCPTGGSGCAGVPPAASWPGNASGEFTASGSLAFPYLLVWHDAGRSSITFQATAVSHATVHPTLPTLTLLLSEAAAAALGLIGAAGVYRGRPPLVSQSAEDAEMVAAQSEEPEVTGPRTGPSGGGSARPPPGPPARGR